MSMYEEIFGPSSLGQFSPQQAVNSGLGGWQVPVPDKPKPKGAKKAARLSMVKAALVSLPPIADAHEAAREAVMRADIILQMLETEEKLKE